MGEKLVCIIITVKALRLHLAAHGLNTQPLHHMETNAQIDDYFWPYVHRGKGNWSMDTPLHSTAHLGFALVLYVLLLLLVRHTGLKFHTQLQSRPVGLEKWRACISGVC